MNEVLKGVKMLSMKRSILPAIALAAGVIVAGASSAQAAPKQVVVVVAQGFTPQVLDIGGAYLKASSTEDEPTIALNDFKAAAKSAPVSGDVVAAMRGILKLAESNGYKTGLVTTNDVTADAALFYDLPATTTDVASALVKDSGFDFLAGGGRTKFVPTTGTNLTTAFKAGNTVLLNADEIQSVEEVKGRVLALQSDESLSYNIDADSSTEAGLGDLASLAMTTLGGDEGNTPYFLVVHDANLLKAITAKDTPAVFGQVRALDGIIAEAISVRDGKEKPADMGLAFFSTGAAMDLKYTGENANDRSNAIFVASQLPSSYSKATTTLKGATEESFTEFSMEYGNWKPSESARSSVIAGTMTGEEAVRASFEPAIGLAYEAKTVAPMAYVIGIGEADVLGNLVTIASTKAK